MADTASVLNVLAHVTTIVAFLVFIVPGFLSLRAFEAKRGGVSRKINEWLVDVVIFSFATDIVAVPIVYSTLQLDSLTLRIAASVVSSVLGFIALPIWLGIAWHQIQTRLAKDGHLADPTAKPWDKMFARIREEKLDVGIIITLPDGRKLGGRYIPPGFASHYPADEQLQVGEMWEMDQESGWFKNRLEGSLGFLIDMKDVLTIEFVDWKNVIPLGETSAPLAAPLASDRGDDDTMSSQIAEIGAP